MASEDDAVVPTTAPVDATEPSDDVSLEKAHLEAPESSSTDHSEYTSILANPESYDVKHPLNTPWTLWYDTPGQKRANASNWQQSLKKLVTFDTVEDFWGVFNNVLKASELAPGSNYHVFRAGIQPACQDPANGKGGKWTIPAKKKPDTDNIWLNVLLAMVGESLDSPTDICGAVASVRARGDRVAVWTKTANDKDLQEQLGKQLKQVCGLAAEEKIGYLIHYDAGNSKNPQDAYRV
ncbi:eukaryotic translation initiation factor 4E [Gonapodya prolifera JEL478]|uniref:Eukaryotic translation initiation factor 4E n=1 Tax=Gonapodya prolifera (strain JEL478) TaxID=1344416 RepID=A0A139ANS2_GONPJ|nr:eukaryotic translation initiation factor 4E [Gonapodya prolifera JEL478]|eukprot:KXS18294.1 eukaryotic translation initiation factor 4E [Gonapodya prolifera JEL478]